MAQTPFRRSAMTLDDDVPTIGDVDEEIRPAKDRAVPAWKIRLLRWTAKGAMALMLVPLAAGGAALGGLTAWLEQAPSIEEFEHYNPPETTTILDRDGKPLAALFEQRRAVVPIKALPPEVPNAFIAIEDERFRNHLGIDPIGVARAMTVNLMRGRMSQGASTITQQTARNLLPSLGSAKTAHRKLTEALIALQMESRNSKDQILEVYLNQIYLGSGTYGVEAAARTYFGKPAAELSTAECALIGGLPQLPEKYSPLNNPDAAKTRRDQVLKSMWKHGYITDAQFDAAIVSPVEVTPDRLPSGRGAYFVDAVRRVLSSHPELEGDQLQTIGWKVRTTVDPAMQEIAETTLREGLEGEEQFWLAGRQERWVAAQEEGTATAPAARGQVRMGRVVRMFRDSLVVELPGGLRADLDIPRATESYFVPDETVHLDDGVDVEVREVEPGRGLWRGLLLPRQSMQGAIVAIDAESGDVRALVGGRSWEDRGNNGYFNRAVMARRQAGSTLKPLFFSAALEDGMLPTSLVDDSPIHFGDGYSPKNYDEKFIGPVSLQRALEQSRNIPTIRVVQTVGLKRSIQFLQRFERGGRPWNLPLEWPVALGTTTVTPLELAAAYQPLANGGLARGPRLIEGIWNEEDREAVGIPSAPDDLVLEPTASAYLTQMMVSVMARGTGHKLREMLPEDLKDKVAGKSGTTNDNRDAWFAGFTPHEVIVVWVGFDQSVPLAPGRTGSKAAGPIWATFAAREWEAKSADDRLATLRLPEGYVLHNVSPEDGGLIGEGEDAGDPPVQRVFQEVEEKKVAPEEEAETSHVVADAQLP